MSDHTFISRFCLHLRIDLLMTRQLIIYCGLVRGDSVLVRLLHNLIHNLFVLVVNVIKNLMGMLSLVVCSAVLDSCVTVLTENNVFLGAAFVIQSAVEVVVRNKTQFL